MSFSEVAGDPKLMNLVETEPGSEASRNVVDLRSVDQTFYKTEDDASS
jgi:hypothetical protein